MGGLLASLEGIPAVDTLMKKLRRGERAAMARHAGLHPATITGILDRLERGGWVAHERDPSDRRAVVVRALRDRNAELFRLYSGMNTAMDQLCASYGDDELQLLADFLHRTTNAGRTATDQLASD
jgi:DNA-binding MarR family transcriptional regulator